jgi:hypothetical protein
MSFARGDSDSYRYVSVMLIWACLFQDLVLREQVSLSPADRRLRDTVSLVVLQLS